MRIAIGSDHAGFKIRTALSKWSRTQGHEIHEFGAQSEEPYDYPDAADEVAHALLAGRDDQGILVCGTGVGMSIRANRYLGIRAANCCSAEMAKLARQHNHANVLCLGERLIQESEAISIAEAFFSSGEDSVERHVRRVEKLDRKPESC